MAALDEFVPVVPSQTDISSDRIVLPSAPTPFSPDNIAPKELTTQEQMDMWSNQPTSLTTKMSPITFDWEQSNAGRYAGNRHLQDLGFEPYAGGKVVDGKVYDLNEIKYQSVQTFGDVMKAGIGQFGALAWNSFKSSAVSDGNFLNAIFNWGSDKSFMERLVGSPDELLAQDKAQKDIMNKYAIFESPETQGVFNKEFLGNMLGQLGFTVGTGAYIALETLLTAGIADAIAPVAKAGQLSRLGRAITAAGGDAAKTQQLVEYAQAVQKGTSTADMVSDIRRMTDLAKDRNFMESVYEGMKNMVPGYQAVGDYKMARVAGATFGEGIAAGFPGFVKTYTMFNAARAEATMEAGNTYGQLYTDLNNKYEQRYGHPATGKELERITRAAYGAATDNFITNTGLLSATNEIEFGNMMSKFSSTKRLFREAAENTGKDLYVVTGKAKGTADVISKAYENGRFGAMGNLNSMRKDFGLGTALWQVGKKAVSGQAAKFEFTEGLQEILQNASDETFRDYYTNLYNGNKDINGNYLKDITSADWEKGLATQLNKEGWKTFLMGATTGLFLSPMSGLTMYARQKGQAAISQEYKDQWDARQKITRDNVDILNSFYANSKDALFEHIANGKTQMASAKNMQDALPVEDRYTFYNSKDDALAKAAAVAAKTGNLPNLLETIRSMGDGRLTDEEFKQGIGYTGKEPISAKAYTEDVAKDIEQYYTNFQNLKDQFGDLVIPEIHTDPLMYRLAKEQKAALNDAIELLATTSYHVATTLKRASEIRTEMAKLPGIGQSVQTSFDVLGNEQQTVKEIAALRDQIATYTALGTSRDSTGKDIARELKLLKQQLSHLESWQQNYEGYSKADTEEGKKSHLQPLQDAFSNYISINNQISGIGEPIIRTDKDKAFKGLSDYITLNRDHGQYIEALNVLSDPRNFKRAYERILKAQQDATTTVHQEHTQEVKERAKATAGGTEETTSDQGEPEEPLTAREDILRYYTEDEAVAVPDEYGGYSHQPRKELSDDAKKLLAKYPGLEAKLESIYRTTSDLKELPAKVEAAIAEYEKKEADKKGQAAEEAAKKKTIQEQWAKDLKEYDKNNPKLEGVTPEQVQAINAAREEINKKYKELLGLDTEATDTGEPVSYPKMRILHSQVTIGPHQEQGESLEDARKRISGILSPLSKEQLLSGLSMTVSRNQTIAADRTDVGNPNIISHGQGYSIQLSYNGQPIGYLTNAGMYTFNVKGTPTIAQNLTVDTFPEFFEVPANMTVEQALGMFKTDAETAQTIQTAIENRLAKGQDTFTGADLYDILSIKPAIQMNWVETGEPAPLFKDIQANREVSIDGVPQMVVVSNKVEEDGSRKHEIILGTPASLEYLHKIPEHENTGMYSAAISVGGDTRWIQLTPTVYEPEQMKVTLDRITELTSKDTRTKQDIQEIKSLIRGIFIALPVYYRNEGGRRVVDKSKKWDIRLGYNETKNKVVVTIDKEGVPPLTTNTSKFQSAEELASAINKVIHGKKLQGGLDNITITQDNFRHQIPVSGITSREDTIKAVLGMTASVHPDVVKSVSLRYGTPRLQDNLEQESQPPVQEQVPHVRTPVQGRVKDTGLEEQQKQTTDRLQAAEQNDVAAMRAARKRAKKVVEAGPFDEHSVENISKFTEWVAGNLPGFISVEDLGILRKNLEDNHITVGQFYTYLDRLNNLKGVIQVGTNSPFKYHEAFHGVFRMLLPEARIQQLLDSARKEYAITDGKVQEFLAERPEYTGKDRGLIEERMLEEYMADKFDAWKMNKKTPASPTLKGFFSWLADLLREFFSKMTGNRMEALFYEVNRGRYKKAGLQSNHFTTQEGVSEPVSKVISIGQKDITTADGRTITVDNYLSQPVADQLSSTIAALYHKTVQDIGQHNKNQVLDSILNKYRDTYNADLPIYSRRASAIDDLTKRADWWDRLLDLETVFTTKDGRDSLKEAVDLHLNIMGYRQELDDDSIASLEEEEGQRNVDTKFKKTSPLAHYSSLSKFLRGYIGSTTYQLDKDAFGNKQLVDGTPIYATCSANKIYNGMLKTLSNTTDDSELLGRLLEYTRHGGNPETVTFIKRVLDAVDFDYDNQIPRKDSILLQQTIKGFQQWSTRYLFTQVTGNNDYRTSYANTKDAARTQFSEWRDNSLSIKKIDTKALTLLSNSLNSTQAETKETTTAIGKLADRISRNIFKETGIQLHPMYIHYSIVANKDPEYRTPDQQKLIDLYPDAYDGRITKSLLDANLITPIGAGDDIFNRDAAQVEISEGDKVQKGYPHQFLMKIAGTNSIFDESVNTMSFTNAANETVYSHQFQNYSFIAVQELNKGYKNLDQEHQSFLADDEHFQTLANRNSIAVEQIDGLRKVYESTSQEGESFISQFLETNREPGATYGDYNKREFLATLLGFYDVTKMPDALVRSGTESFYRVPVLTRVIEAKNSGHVVRVPVIKAVDSTGKLSKVAQDRLYDIVKQEFDRIRVAQAEIAAGGNIVGYHTAVKDKGPRGLEFFNSRLMLGDLAEPLETLAQNTTKNLDEHKQEIVDQLQKYWQEQTKELAKEMYNEGLIKSYKVENGRITATNLLAPSFLFKGFTNSDVGTKMNINQDFGHNLAQILVNDYLNTTALNTMIFGNEAKSFVDSIDQVKRMAGANADGPNMNISFTAPDMGIDHTLENFHHVTYRSEKVLSDISGNPIDSDDGQMYMTEKGLRYMLFGLGKLTKQQADILTKLANGGRVTEKEFFGAGGLKDTQGAFNSTKLVYFDGNTYLKCSAIPLFKEYTDRPWSKELDDLRKKLEDYEDRNSTVVFAHPVSVSKALKQNIAPSSAEITDEHFNELQSRFMREQLQNPSNKLVITDPTQAKQQIMAEQDPGTKVMFLGTETTVGALREMYMDDISQRITNNYGVKANSIFTLEKGLIHLQQAIQGKITPELGRFFDTMREVLQATGADQQTLGFLETRDGKPVYNLNFPSTLEKFTQIYLNYFSKGVTAEKVPGMTVALVSGAKGMGRRIKQVISVDEQTGQPKQWRVITDAEYRKNPQAYSTARDWDNRERRTYDGLQPGDYYIDDLRHNVPEYDTNGNIIGRFSECIIPAHYKEQMKGQVSALEKLFGIRIPTDDKHSMLSLRWIDTMPVQYGSSAVFPHELIEISGADFDIDKMFIQMADTYQYGPDRVAYGNNKTPSGQFSEYVQWQLDNNKEFRKLVEGDQLFTPEELTHEILGNDTYAYRIEQALRSLGMPSTIQEFTAQGGTNLNNGVLNNRILAQRITMLNNEHISGGENSRINQPTSTDPLAALADDLIREFEAIDPNHPILKILREGQVDTNSLLGKINAYANNKEGARNIGATANAIQVYSLLQQYNVPIQEGYRIRIDGHEYDSFGHTREYVPGNIRETVYTKGGKKVKEYVLTTGEKVKPGDSRIEQGGYTGERIPAVLGTLLNAMTDNAKERLAARLGLNITALGYVSYMVAQGVPMRTSVLLMLQPSVRKYFAQLQKLDGSLKTAEEQRQVKSRLLQETIDNLGVPSSAWELSTKDLVDNIITPDIGTELTALMYLQKIDDQSKTMADISKVQKLSQGIPTTWEDIDRMNQSLEKLNIMYSDGRYIPMAPQDSSSLPVDVQDILLNKQKIIATNLKVLGQVQQLSVPVFMEKTPLFSRMSDIAWSNLSVRRGQQEEFGKTLKHDIISYLSIRAYMNWLGKNHPQPSLDNALIYPQAKAQKSASYEDIHDIIDRLKGRLVDENSNALLSFLMTAEKDGVLTAEANTWARLSDLQQDRLVSAYVDLYTDNYRDTDGNIIPTHDDAVAMFNYLLVKDGGQFRSGSFIRYIPNFVFKDIMDQTTAVNELLSQKGWNEQKAQDIFGVDSAQILNDFMVSYGTHIGNRFYVPTIQHTPSATPNALARVGDAFHISIYRNIREKFQVAEGNGLYYSSLYKTDKFNEQETAQYKENIKTLEAAGFTIADGKVVLPYSIKVNNQLYVLKNVGSDEQAAPNRVIAKDQTTATGVSGQYIRAQWTGSTATFKAAGVFGIVSQQQSQQDITQSTQPVVSSQQLSPEQWKSELSTLYGTDMNKIKEALAYRNEKRQEGLADNDILQKIKDCL